jgi:RNA polymerase sigma-70 factor (ECF subfamily)
MVCTANRMNDPAYPAYFRKLYQESEAERVGLTFADFAQSLREIHPSFGEGSYRTLHLKDLALAQACIRAIPGAWDTFSQRYRDGLLAAALIISRNDSVAHELADSIYGDIFVSRASGQGTRQSRLGSYTGRGALEGWLKAVLSQAYIDRYRSQRRLVSLDEHLMVIRTTLFSDLPAAVDPRLGEAIKEAFLALPAESRFLLAGYFFDQRTLAELARTLGVHESTISRRLDRLTKLLRTRIGQLLRGKGMTLRQVQESFRTDVRDLSLDLRSHFARE